MIIANRDDPNIREFISLKKNILPHDTMVAESTKVVLKALSTNQKIIKIFCTDTFYKDHIEVLRNYEDILFTANRSIMESIIGHKLHHGVMALIKKPQDYGLNKLDERIIVLNGLTSPENIGTIIRTAASFNIRSIIIDKKTCSPYLRRCIRVSMGNIFYVKVHLSDNLGETVQELQKNHYKVISAANSSDAKPLETYSFSKKVAIIIGSEGHGVDKNIIAISNDVVKINIKNDVAHINAASAASIFLYQLSLMGT